LKDEGCLLPSGISLKSRASSGQKIYRNAQWLPGGLMLKAHRLLYHSTLGLNAIKKKQSRFGEGSQTVRLKA